MKTFIVLFFSLVCAESSSTTNPIVEVEDGKIQGHLVEPEDGRPHYAFKEIPYAAPPIGELRLAEPVPPRKWAGIRDATKNTKICNFKRISYIDPDPKENEDCLYLNVFTPRIPESNKDALLPVYVYIFGGAYSFGDPTLLNFQGFVDEDIVVISMNYRSALGFIATGDNVIPGNIAIKDQILALKWINRNIGKFGGDSGKVTLGGHSSGAFLAGYHLLNTKEKGLFRSVILQSGSPLVCMSFNPNPRYFAFELGKQLSADFTSKNSSEDLLKLLRSVPIEKITEAEIPYPDWFLYPLRGYRALYAPVIEDPNYENATVTGPMHENFEKGNSNHVPLLIGITSEEVIHWPNLTSIALNVDANITNILDPTLRIKKENFVLLAKDIKDMYSKDKSYTENMPGLVNAVSDSFVAIPVMNTAYLHSKYADVYFYKFSYKSAYNGIEYWRKYEWFDPKVNGKASHTDELPLLYRFQVTPDVAPSAEDLKMRKKMIKLWTNFVKYTKPVPITDPSLQNITWPAVKQDNFNYLEIDSNMTTKKNPSRFIEWQSRLDKYFDSPRYSY